eukprot:scaffold101355_cov23-Tisochrysis_lutea.AAC.2
MSSNMPSGRPVSKDQHHDHRRQPCTMAVYLTSATPLVPLQLQRQFLHAKIVMLPNWSEACFYMWHAGGAAQAASGACSHVPPSITAHMNNLHMWHVGGAV